MSKIFRYGDDRAGAGQITVRGKRLFLRVADESTHEKLSAAAQKTLEKALSLLERTNAALNREPARLDERVKRCGKRYFLLDDISSEDLSSIKAIVDVIWTGLSADQLTIKTARKITKEGEDNVFGAVQARPYEKGKHGDTVKTYHHKVKCLKTGVELRRGEIRIRADILEDEILGPETLLHEASHRFAGTFDHCYFVRDGSRPEEKWKDFKTSEMALQNADSYGFFILKVGSGDDVL